jgi:OmpA-OmpF porin, OOP family
MNKLTPLCQGVSLMLLLCHAGLAGAQTLAAPSARISDQAVAADHAVYATTQARLQSLNEKGVPLRDYYMSKAQCWLDVSVHEYTRNDRSAFPQLALSESAAIIGALENGTKPNPGDQTPLVNNAAKLRPDLWARFDALKQGAGAVCAAQRIACAEVELVHAGNEYNQQGWRHANPYVQIAEDQVQAAQEAAGACAAPPNPAPLVLMPPPLPARPGTVIEKLSLSADALFRFDKSGLKDLLPEGRAQIDRMMERLDKVYARIDSITLTGHTDRLGTDAYNLPLSQARAATVRAYLVSKGATARIDTAGKGESEQIVPCTAVAPRAALIACLQPNRRVEVEISGSKR